MSLNSDDKKWIGREIRSALDSIKPNIQDPPAPSDPPPATINPRPRWVFGGGWAKFVRWLREWGIVGASLSVVVTLLGIMLTAVYFAVTEKSQTAEFRGATNQRLVGIEKDVVLIQKGFAELTERLRKQIGFNLQALIPPPEVARTLAPEILVARFQEAGSLIMRLRNASLQILLF